MTRTVKVIENDLDVATQIILLENVQNHQKIRTKELLSEALGAIAVKKMMKRSASSEICIRVDLEPDEWIKDSGCSKHMTGNRKLFFTYKVYNGSNIIFDSNLCRNIIGKGQISDIIKQAHASHKAKNVVLTTRCLELLDMESSVHPPYDYGGNRYTYSSVDDYQGCSIVSIKTNHGREFDNEVKFGEFCNTNSITHNFSATCTPESNGVVERKNRTLQEMSRTMLNEQSLPQKFWCNAVDTSTYILNRILIRVILGKTPYELLKGRKSTLDYSRMFGSKCFILNTKDYLTKFDPKSYEGVFLGYSQNSKAYIILNKQTRKFEESLNVTFDETPPPSKISPLMDDDSDEEEAIMVTKKKNLENNIVDETLEVDEIIIIKESRNHPLENVIGNLNQRTLRSQAQNQTLDELAYGIPSDGPYQTNLPSIKDIISSILIDRYGHVCRILHEEEIDVLEYQVLTHEIEPTPKPLDEIIHENVFCLGGNRDHVPACLSYMLYCVVHFERFNLAYFMAKRMEWVTKQKM
ncbi:retrovirus-related pol polyprotein from transposon TNT 1-94 [Tanacetum coccineum]